MSKKTIVKAAATAAVLAVGIGGPASADTQTHVPSLAKNGSVSLVKSNGSVCRIYTSQDLSSSTCLNASLVRVENRGYTSGVGGKSSVRLYYNRSSENGGRSAYACISPSDVWQKSSGGTTVHFSAGSTGAGSGYNKPIWNDVARVQWVTGC